MNRLEKLNKLCEGNDMEQMKKWFVERTNKHINLVRKYTGKIAELNIVDNEQLLHEAKIHDENKFKDPEYTPYLHITWRYKLSDEGKEYQVPTGMDAQLHEATFHHVKTHKHHPEYWDDKATKEVINPTNRDKPAKMVDATKMPLPYVASMVADWLAMSEEKDTDPRKWVESNVNIRWKFTEEQVSLINELIDKTYK